MVRHGLAAAAGIVPSLLSSATETGFNMTTIIDDAVNTTQSQMFTVLGKVTPAIVAVTAAVVGIKFAVSWLKKIKA